MQPNYYDYGPEDGEFVEMNGVRVHHPKMRQAKRMYRPPPQPLTEEEKEQQRI